MAAENSTDGEVTPFPCGHCGDQSSKQCGQCKNMRYCSIECQQADWQFHKYLCKDYVAQIEHGPPEPDRRLAIIMTESEAKPFFMWMPVKSEPSIREADPELAPITEDDFPENLRQIAHQLDIPLRDKGEGTAVPEVSDVFSMGPPKPVVLGNLGRGKLLDHAVHMAPTAGYGMKNKCLERMLGEAAGAHYRRGVIFFAMTKVWDSSVTVDIDTRAFTLALDGLLDAANLPRILKKVRAVKINAHEPQFEEIEVPSQHPVFTKGIISGISKLFIPRVRMLKYPTSATPTSTPALTSANLPLSPAAWLHVNIDTSSPDFGKVPSAAQTDSASILVVADGLQADGSRKPLPGKLVESTVVATKEIYAYLNDVPRSPKERLQELELAISKVKEEGGSSSEGLKNLWALYGKPEGCDGGAAT